MTGRVDFYLLSEPAHAGKLTLACRLAEKAYRLGHMIYVYTNDDDETRRVDDLLWTFQDGSFVPHAPLRELTEDDDRYPVVVGNDPPPAWLDNVLISLRPDVPECFIRFQRIVEPVAFDEHDKARARERFRYYRDQGAILDTHHIGLKNGSYR